MYETATPASSLKSSRDEKVSDAGKVNDGFQWIFDESWRRKDQREVGKKGIFSDQGVV